MQIIKNSIIGITKLFNSIVTPLFLGTSLINITHVGKSTVAPQILLNSTVDLEII